MSSQTAIGANFGPRVRQARMQIECSLSTFGKIIGVTGETVRRWEEGTATPHPNQRVKLDAVKSILSGMTDPRDELLCAGIDQNLAKSRRLGEEHPNVFRMDLKDAADPRVPNCYFDLAKEFEAENWESLLRWAAYFKDELGRLPSPQRENRHNWVGTAMLRLGRYEEAEQELKAGLAICQCETVRTWLNNNLGVVMLSQHRLADAEALLEAVAAADSRCDSSRFNLLCIASLQRDMDKSARRCGELLEFHHGSIHRKSSRGRALQKDPDLAWLRSTDMFTKHFPGLAKKNRKATVSAQTLTALVIIISALSFLGLDIATARAQSPQSVRCVSFQYEDAEAEFVAQADPKKTALELLCVRETVGGAACNVFDPMLSWSRLKGGMNRRETVGGLRRA